MKEPLAQRLRPRTLDEVCGQRHLLAPGQVFRRTIDRGVIPNMIFYGPSGVGKTTVASIIAANSGMRLYKLNGTTASTSDIKSVLGDIGTLHAANGILLYLDEIQYFNKRQQQSLLECVEQGTVTLIASTTENPYFYVYNALLSRCTVFEFKSLTAEDIAEGVKHAAQRLGESDGTPVNIPVDALEYLAQSAGGDMRKALAEVQRDYDFIFIDCPPSLDLLTLNGLSACDSVLIPVQCEYYALEGLSELISTLKTIRKKYNPYLDIEGVVFTMFSLRYNLTVQVVEQVQKYFGSKVYKTTIPRSIRISEAPSYGQPINFYEPKGKGSEAYMDLAIEFVKNNRPHEPKKARSKSAPVAEQTKNALED